MSTTDPDPTLGTRSGLLLSVGETAETIDVPAATLRTWERRYGLGPSARTAGGHRRYDDSDLEALRTMVLLLDQGAAPADAARTALRSRPDKTAAEAEPLKDADASDVDRLADAVIAAARAYDSTLLRTLFNRCLDEHGTATAWADHVVPAMRRIGDAWFTGAIGVDGEHLVSDALTTVLRARFAAHRVGKVEHRPVLLAGAENEHHSLPLLALQGSLADVGISCHLLGPRTPGTALAAMTIHTDPAVVFVWASMPRLDGASLEPVLQAAADRAVVLVGGPGWDDVPIGAARQLPDLPAAVEAIQQALQADGPGPSA